ncbi:MAG: 3-(methylthio)propionyl-CoA ligase, partial [Holophagales bacterium]|nr:3-(methylthio)propionyl-CoA ligase [Holophagales bacterium]
SLIQHAGKYHADTEIVTRTVEGPIHRQTHGDAHRRSRQLAMALDKLGVGEGDRIATLAWNTHRHFELYFAVSGMGAVCHTVNPRLFAEQLVYIFEHAEDRFVFVDLSFVPIVEKLADQLPKVEGWVILTDREHMPETSLPGALCYEELLAAEEPSYPWPELDENTASSLCYTSGTTGHPKGVLYSHRSTVLHSYGVCMLDTLAISARDAVLPVVPMFPAHAWGLPYACALCGAKMVMPGARLDGESVWQLLHDERVTQTAGVPTVWLMLLDYMRREGKTLETVDQVVIGGSAAPRAMIEEFQERHGARVLHAWGMTETSPLGTVGSLKAEHDAWPKEKQVDLQLKQGRGIAAVEMRIVDEEGNEQPRDGKAFGELQVRGPWVVRRYFKGEGGEILDRGWFPTGDVATLDPGGYMQITDRAKDVIKSGGEWISSIDLENEAVSHPKVAEAAVVGVPHPKWTERPVLVVVPAEGESPTQEELMAHLEPRVAKWWLPDDVLFRPELPHTATGKISKRHIRDQLREEGYSLPEVKTSES